MSAGVAPPALPAPHTAGPLLPPLLPPAAARPRRTAALLSDGRAAATATRQQHRPTSAAAGYGAAAGRRRRAPAQQPGGGRGRRQRRWRRGFRRQRRAHPILQCSTGILPAAPCRMGAGALAGAWVGPHVPAWQGRGRACRCLMQRPWPTNRFVQFSPCHSFTCSSRAALPAPWCFDLHTPALLGTAAVHTDSALLPAAAAHGQVDKAGADALFRDPSRKSSNVGVTVYPVTIERLEQVRLRLHACCCAMLRGCCCASCILAAVRLQACAAGGCYFHAAAQLCQQLRHRCGTAAELQCNIMPELHCTLYSIVQFGDLDTVGERLLAAGGAGGTWPGHPGAQQARHGKGPAVRCCAARHIACACWAAARGACPAEDGRHAHRPRPRMLAHAPATERAKDSTLGVAMVAAAARALPGGAAGAGCCVAQGLPRSHRHGPASRAPPHALFRCSPRGRSGRARLCRSRAYLWLYFITCPAAVYDFEYELESTRGRKRILSTGAGPGRTVHGMPCPWPPRPAVWAQGKLRPTPTPPHAQSRSRGASCTLPMATWAAPRRAATQRRRGRCRWCAASRARCLCPDGMDAAPLLSALLPFSLRLRFRQYIVSCFWAIERIALKWEKKHLGGLGAVATLAVPQTGGRQWALGSARTHTHRSGEGRGKRSGEKLRALGTQAAAQRSGSLAGDGHDTQKARGVGQH